MRFFYYLIFSLFVQFTSNAQTQKLKGFIVLNNQDTLQGYIHYKGWANNPKSIDFQKDSSEKSFTTYTLKDISFFEVSHYDGYKRAVIKKDSRPLNFMAPWPLEKDSTVTDTVFLRILIKNNPLGLYELIDEKIHYFISDKDNYYEELEYKLVLVPETIKDWYRLPKYKDQLRSHAFQENMYFDVRTQIEQLEYNEKDITSLVKRLNKQKKKEKDTYSKGKVNRWNWFAGVNGGISTINMKSYYELYGTTKDHKANPFFGITAGIQAPISRQLDEVQVNAQLSFISASYNFNTTMGSFKISQKSISPGLSVLYNYLRKSNLRAYVGVGIQVHFSSYSKKEYTYTYYSTTKTLEITPRKFWFNNFLKTGVVINKHWDINATISPYFINDFIYSGRESRLKSSFTSFGFNYQF